MLKLASPDRSGIELRSMSYGVPSGTTRYEGTLQ